MIKNDRFLVFVFDRIVGHIIFKANTNNKKREFCWIKKYYGEKHCDPPTPENTPVDIRRYE